MSGLTKPLRIVVLVVAVAVTVVMSHHLARSTYQTDFPILYRAGRVALEPSSTRDQLYEPSVLASIPVPEITSYGTAEMRFIWPAAAATALAGISWLPYYLAKTVMVLLNVASYVIAITLLLRSLNAPRKTRQMVLVLSCFWPPFVENLLYGQINAVLLLLVVLACLFAKERLAFLSGASIAVASTLKVFPLGVAAFLGMRDYRIAVGGVALFSAMLVGQPLEPWLSLLAGATSDHRSIAYELLAPANAILPVVYSIGVILTGLGIAFRRRALGPEWLGSFGVTTLLLASPMAEYYHLTVAVLAYVYLATRAPLSNWVLGATVLSASACFLAPFVARPYHQALLWGSLAIIWVALALVRLGRLEARNPLVKDSRPQGNPMSTLVPQ